MNINNISPNIWGSSGWNFLHYITFTYPNEPTEEDKDTYLNFFKFVGKVLPCKNCRINYEKHQEKYPLNDIVLYNKENLIKWLIDIHNEVNLMNGKKVLSYDEVINNYFGKNNKKIYKLNKKSMILLFIFIVIIILCLILKTYSK
jgi:hypothetical protein